MAAAERALFSLIRLAFLYCVFGVGILFVQFNNTPCSAPVVFDDGGPPIGPPIDLTRISTDSAYGWRVGRLVVFWLPRLVDLVGIRGMPFPDYLFGSQCRKVPAMGAAAVPAPPVTLPQQPQPFQPPAASQPLPPEPLPRPRS